jgi:L-aspartate oxidase
MSGLQPREKVDFLVLGGGAAGLSFALHAADHGSVLVLTKRQRFEGSTQYAQGGVAAVLGPDDDFSLHIEDTLIAGAGLCKRDAVDVTVREGPDRIRWLQSLGIDLDREATDEGPARLHLTREGGHSRRRVAHAKDASGREVERTLLEAAEAKGIRIVEDTVAIDLITTGKLGQPGPNAALGAYVLDRASGDISTVEARVTVLATGGGGKVYLYTSNPDVATGDGVAMAYRAGAAVANMEFYQFHPTCLFHPQAKSFLISEALRGEGGILRNAAGEAFMARYDPRKELAPRDIVARAIDAETKRRGDDCAFLDMSHLPKGFLLEHFPNIYATCKEFGIDMAVQPIPVVPAAHYMCGGVLTDLEGRTSIPRLFAAGETSCTGLHGANRLASNSLLEALVFGRRAALRAIQDLSSIPASSSPIPDWNSGDALAPEEGVVVAHNWDEVRRVMWNYVGIVRTEKRLERARARLRMLRSEIREYYWQYRLTPDLVELRNVADVAMLVVECARRRKESRGLHYLLDFPTPDDRWIKDTVLSRGDDVES